MLRDEEQEISQMADMYSDAGIATSAKRGPACGDESRTAEVRLECALPLVLPHCRPEGELGTDAIGGQPLNLPSKESPFQSLLAPWGCSCTTIGQSRCGIFKLDKDM